MGPTAGLDIHPCRKLNDSYGVGVGRSRILIPAGEDMFLLQNRPDLLWAPTSPLFSGYQISIPRIKRLGRELDYSFPSSAEVKNEWSYTAAPHIRLHGENDKRTFTHLNTTSTSKHT